MACITGGLMNKRAAAEIGITPENTVKVYRGDVTRKMGANSLVDLVRMADLLGVQRCGGNVQCRRSREDLAAGRGACGS